jgi:DNA-binding transcriptional ArsR family regulator
MPIKKLRPVSEQTCCKPLLTDRPLMTPIQAGGLSVVFKVLANDTQLRLLHALLRAGEPNVTDLAVSVGMKPQAVSNQLQRLSDLGIVAFRRDGNTIIYRVVDRCVSGLLDQGWCLMDETNAQTPAADAVANGVRTAPGQPGSGTAS